MTHPGNHPNARIGTEALRNARRARQSEMWARKRREKAQLEARNRLAYPDYPGTQEDLNAAHRQMREEFYRREAERRAA